MKLLTVLAISACAGLVFAGATSITDGPASASVEAPAFFTITVDICGSQFWDAQGSVLNEIQSIDLGPNFFVTGIGWDLTLTTVGASWASDAIIAFQDEIFLTPAVGDDFGVINIRYFSGGVIDLNDIGYDDIHVDADGFLNLELYEAFDDNPEDVDAFLGDGSVLYLNVAYPSPGSAVTLSLGLLCCGRRRREGPQPCKGWHTIAL